MSVIVINPMNDIHCKQMVQRLQQRNIDVLELRSPAENDYAWLDGQLLYNGQAIQSVHGVYFRSLLKRSPSVSTDQEKKYNEQIQFMAQVEALKSWMTVMHQKGVRVINPPRHNYKYNQLYILQELGIPIPKTCITSSPNLARSFIQQVKQAVCKPLQGGSYCRRVDESVLNQLFLIENEPVIFQEEIPGVDVRVNMLGGHVISAHIIQKEESVLDYRMDADYQHGSTQYKEVTLPEEVAAYCAKAMQALGLHFSGIDLRRTPDQRYVLLECNSMPAFLDIEMKTGAPITDSLIDFMLQGPPIPFSTNNLEGPYVHQLKEGRAPKGHSLFNYYQVASEYASLQHHSQETALIRLNEEQRHQIKMETGEDLTFAQVVIVEGKPKVMSMW